jgi:nondiscriminating aspartyl-tRNA synthetase
MSRIRRSLISALKPERGTAVMVRGWVYRLRVLARTTFIILKDCTGEAQCVAATEALRDLHVKLDDAVEIHGVVRGDERARAGFEIDVSQIVMLNPAASLLPFNSSSDISHVSAEIRTEYRPLALRNESVGDVFRIQAAILGYFREYLISQHFTEIVSSKIVGGGTEGGTNLFEIKIFRPCRVSRAESPILQGARRRRPRSRIRNGTCVSGRASCDESTPHGVLLARPGNGIHRRAGGRD